MGEGEIKQIHLRNACLMMQTTWVDVSKKQDKCCNPNPWASWRANY